MTPTLDVCICTYRRASVEAAIESVARQRLADVELHLIVADNDDADTRRSEIEAMGRRLGLALTYVHAPVRNISVARNACLDAATADWIAFIDDDEEAADDWAAQLLAARDLGDIVFGVSQATYPDPAIPRWIVEGDFHSNRIAGNDAAWNGYTANVLIDRRFVEAHNLRFSPRFGQTGGEDTMFFLAANRAGARFAYAPHAIVREATPRARATLRWLALRRYRSGQIHYAVLQTTGGRFRGTALAVVKSAASFAIAATRLRSPAQAARHGLRAMLHLGVLASALGFGLYREYARTKEGKNHGVPPSDT